MKSGNPIRACRLRFVSRSQEPIRILWLNYAGDEQEYACIQPGGQHIQATYTTHPWRSRGSQSGRVYGEYCGEDAVLELSVEGQRVALSLQVLSGRGAANVSPGPVALQVHPWPSRHICARSAPTPAHWGQYCQRGEALGIPIMAFQCVSKEAVAATVHTLHCMLQHTPPQILQRLRESDADVGIIGRHQVTSDLPPHQHLKGQDCASGQRTFDNGTRGLGGSIGCPTCSVGEENVTMAEDRHYPSENILIHEFSHSCMEIGMEEQQRQSVAAAYEGAKQSGIYDLQCYMMENPSEYFAEGTQSWFDATARTDVNSGLNSREAIEYYDPPLAAILAWTFGRGGWRYPHSMPKPFAKGPPGRTVPDSFQTDTPWQQAAPAARSPEPHPLSVEVQQQCYPSALQMHDQAPLRKPKSWLPSCFTAS